LELPLLWFFRMKEQSLVLGFGQKVGASNPFERTQVQFELLCPREEFEEIGLFRVLIPAYCLRMNDLWKFSKSTALILALTGFVGICVLTFAYHLHHYTEILTGVIGGLTIILGMVTAEWLRSAREAVVSVRSSIASLVTRFSVVVYNAEFMLDDPYSKAHREEYIASQEVMYELKYLQPRPDGQRLTQKRSARRRRICPLSSTRCCGTRSRTSTFGARSDGISSLGTLVRCSGCH